MKHVLAGALHEATAKACMAPDRHPARCAVRLKACFLNSTLRFFRDLPALCTGLPPTTILLARLLSGCLPWSLAQRRSGTAENSSLFRLRIHGFHIRAWRLPLGRHCLSRVPNQSQLQSACSGGRNSPLLSSLHAHRGTAHHQTNVALLQTLAAHENASVPNGQTAPNGETTPAGRLGAGCQTSARNP